MRIEWFIRYMLAYTFAIALVVIAAPVRIACGVYKAVTEALLALPLAVSSLADDLAGDMEPDD